MKFDLETLSLDLQGYSLQNLSALPARITTIVRAPSKHPLEALLFLAIVVLLLLIIVMTIVMLVFRSPKPRVYALVADDSQSIEGSADADTDKGGAGTESDVSLPGKSEARYREVTLPKDTMKKYYSLLLVFIMLVLMWGATGVVTRGTWVCRTCHGRDEHITALKTSVHKGIACVDCHDSAGLTGVYVDTPARVAHIVVGSFRQNQVEGYQNKTPGYRATAESGCRSCHKETLTKPTWGSGVGSNLHMSHKEPVAAGFACSDCHVVGRAEEVTKSSSTMQTCLKCHNGVRAKTECNNCHLSTPTARSKTGASEANAQDLLTQNPQTQCYNCHNPRSCDSCHGLRIPHPQNFNHVSATHQRGEKMCMKCHREGSSSGATPCSKCH